MLPAGSTAQFYAEDLLGSSRVVTTNVGVVCYDADFYPYGSERTVTNSCIQNVYKYEGKERDTETGNDDFGARYYSNRLGRWLSADWSNIPAPVPYANLTNPQTLNLYSMVADDPESFADLDGHGPAGTSSATRNPGGGACIDDGTEVGVCPPPMSVTDKQAAQVQNLAANQAVQNQKGVAATQTYKTRDEAAKAAEKAALNATDKSGGKYEYGGLILKNKEGQYTYTIAVTFKDQEHFYPESVTIPKGFSKVGDYHTHAHSDRAQGEGLSAGDEQHAYDYHRRVYEADTYSRNMYRFTPGKSEYKPNQWCCGVIGDFVL